MLESHEVMVLDANKNFKRFSDFYLIFCEGSNLGNKYQNALMYEYLYIYLNVGICSVIIGSK